MYCSTVEKDGVAPGTIPPLCIQASLVASIHLTHPLLCLVWCWVRSILSPSSLRYFWRGEERNGGGGRRFALVINGGLESNLSLTQFDC